MERIRLNDFLQLEKQDLKGKVICFPTDTVYGLGAMIDDVEAIDKIFEIKGRDFIKPLANLIGEIKSMDMYIVNLPVFIEDIINKYWPGPLTIIFEKKEEVKIKNNFKTISFRMPNSSISLPILKKFGPFATTSVNKSGEKEISNLKEIEDHFASVIDYLIIDEAILSNIPSTVIDITKGKIEVLRKGVISFE